MGGRGSRLLLTLDVDDHIDPETRDWLTLDDEGRIVRTPEHEARAAELGVRVEAWRRERQFATAEQARWAGSDRKQGAGGRAHHGFFRGLRSRRASFQRLGWV